MNQIYTSTRYPDELDEIEELLSKPETEKILQATKEILKWLEKKNKLELENLLTELCNRIKDHYELDEILLFGSYAKGTANEWSDVDVAVISPSLNKRSVLGNVLDISNKIKFYDSDLQLTAFPSQNFYQESFDPQS